jgi:hypothetical protein
MRTRHRSVRWLSGCPLSLAAPTAVAYSAATGAQLWVKRYIGNGIYGSAAGGGR